ncbi:MAG: hypothetical protein IIB57_11115 [Planctomycetes bacterium]|nr:hypothetical protein [Planctomycetota bacterium]
MTVGDLNGDSQPDVLVVGAGVDRIRVLLNAGVDDTGAWRGYEVRRDFAVGGAPIVTVIADANFDGFPEAIVALDRERKLVTLQNLGLDSSSNWLGFAPPVFVGDIGSDPRGVAAVDVNDDGAADFIVASRGAGSLGNWTGQSAVSVFRQIPPATTDCNQNNLPDDCDIAAATSVDCDENGMPDECEPDCNDNGVVDACDLSSETSFDCNENDVLDDCELAAGEATDCDNNTTLDVCELPFTFTAEFGPFGPTWAYQPGEHVIEAPPLPSGDVYVIVETSARLSAAARYEVYLNDLLIRDLFEGVEIACTGEPAVESFVISAEMFMELVGGGDAVFKVFAWGQDCYQSADHVSYYRLTVSYESDPGTDCNANRVLDVCENDAGDCNDNGVADLCESDADGDGVIDDCDECPESSVGETIVINGCETRVVNQVFDDGCTMVDELANCAEELRNHGAYVSCVARVANSWRRDGMISDDEHGRVVSCAAKQHTGRILVGATHGKNESVPQK